MTSYIYVAVDASGRECQGNIQEKTLTSALRRVKEMGLFPTRLRERDRAVDPPRAGRLKVQEKTLAQVRIPGKGLTGGGVSTKTLVAFTRQIATLVEAGIPLIKGLRAIDKQERNRSLKGILRTMISDIEGGSMFSEALAKHPRIFNRLYINMVIAGETGGMLETTLARLADYIERLHKIKAKIVTALCYPAAVVTVAIAMLALLTMFVVPRFKEVFVDLTGGRPLPWFTEFVLSTSVLLKNHVFYLLAAGLAAVGGLKLAGATVWGRTALDRLKLNLPVVGTLIQKTSISRFSRMLGTLLQSGVPILQALTIAREATSNTVFAHIIDRLHSQVKEGDNITPTLEASAVFPATMVSMIDVGEQTGALPDMLLKVADGYDNEVDNLVGALMSLLEPALIIGLAVIVGSIVIALFLPLIALVSGGLDGGTGRPDF